MEIAIGVPLGLFSFYLMVRIASYAICKSIKQVFQPKEMKHEEKQEQKKAGLAQ